MAHDARMGQSDKPRGHDYMYSSVYNKKKLYMRGIYIPLVAWDDIYHGIGRNSSSSSPRAFLASIITGAMDRAMTATVASAPTEEVKILLWPGSSKCFFKHSIGPIPWTAAWEQNPIKATMARRAFLISLSLFSSEAMPIGSNGCMPNAPDSPVLSHPLTRRASRTAMTGISTAKRVLVSKAYSLAPAVHQSPAPTRSVKRIPATAAMAHRPLVNSASL
mmetsp:Transcript_6401/g.12637  ORF Transcript_6401/g.12637 Transcript_6401/m.12637 type:complete len:219 (-) Transcript_6401:210-866(-)